MYYIYNICISGPSGSISAPGTPGYQPYLRIEGNKVNPHCCSVIKIAIFWRFANLYAQNGWSFCGEKGCIFLALKLKGPLYLKTGATWPLILLKRPTGFFFISEAFVWCSLCFYSWENGLSTIHVLPKFFRGGPGTVVRFTNSTCWKLF